MALTVFRFPIATALLCHLVVAPPAWAQTQASDSTPSQPKPLTEAQVQANDAALDRIQSIRSELATLAEKEERATALTKAVYERRLKDRWYELLAEATAFARQVADQSDAGHDISSYRPRVEELLDKLPGEVRRNIGRSDLTLDDFPKETMSAQEQLAYDSKLLRVTQERDRLYQTLLTNLLLAERFGVPTAVDGPALREMLSERAESQSVYLELTSEQVSSLRFQAASLPKDDELRQRLAVAESRKRLIAKSLGETVRMMDQLKMDTARFRQQVVKATGEISSEALDTQVLGGIFKEWLETTRNWFTRTAPSFLVKALTFLVVVYVFVLLGRVAKRLVMKAIDASGVRMSVLLRRMVVSMTRNLILLIGILIAVSQIGISVGPVLAGLGIAGFIVGFALQDTLSNFASGMMILFYRPFDVGDVVEAGGVFGKVSHMSLVNTTILTFDNQTLVIPNNKIWGDVIKNVTAQKIRRVDMTFGISYSDDIPKAESILRDILTSHEKTLDDPEPVVKLHKLGESSVDFIARPWVNRDDYWDVYWDITREVKMRFDAEDVTIPFPQRDVHLHASAKADWIQQLGGRRKPGPADAAAPEQDTTAASPIEPDTND